MKIYPREEKKIHGLDQAQLTEAMTMYSKKVRSDIIENLEDEFNIDFSLIDDNGKLLSYFYTAIDQAMTKGMELAENTRLLTRYYEQNKNVIVNKVLDYKFEIDKGISGVLFPDGSFSKCGNAQHHYLMENIPHEVQFGCLYFSSNLRSDGDGVISNSPIQFKGITENQNIWLKDNFKYMDRGQKRTSAFDFGIEG